MNIELKELNDKAKSDLFALCMQSDRDYLAQLTQVCDALEAAQGKRKVLLLAGPSGSGKTTSAALIEEILHERGHEAWDISLDDFYRPKNDPLYPRDENGQLDMESVHSLRVDKIRECIASLLSGKETVIPRYIFGEIGEIVEDGEHITVPEGGVVIIEGLHALNPLLTEGLLTEGIFRMFISVSTNVTVDGKRIISGRKLRFIRRMVRDFYYRGMSADRTYQVWQSVLAGEDKYLYPYRHLADVSLNTFHPCETAVMKPFVLPVLETLTEKNDYTDTVRSAVEEFFTVSEEEVLDTLSESSLLREFIPREE